MAGKGTVNSCHFVGNLGADPETRYTPSNLAVTKINIATTEVRKNKDTGESVEETEWIRVTMFGKLGEIAAQYLSKGAKVYIEGRMKTSKYEKEGQTHYSTEIIANQMTMLGGKDQAQSQGGQRPAQPRQQPRQQQQPAQGGGGEDLSDDIPFAAYMRRAEYLA